MSHQNPITHSCSNPSTLQPMAPMPHPIPPLHLRLLEFLQLIYPHQSARSHPPSLTKEKLKTKTSPSFQLGPPQHRYTCCLDETLFRLWLLVPVLSVTKAAMYALGWRNLPSLVLMSWRVLACGLPGIGLFRGIARKEASRQPGGVGWLIVGSGFMEVMIVDCVPRMKASSWASDH